MNLTSSLFTSVMPRYYRKSLAVSVIVDIVTITLAYILALSVRSFTAWIDMRPALVFLFFIVLLQIPLLYLFGAYHRIWSQTSGHDVAVIFLAVAAATVPVVVASLFLSPRPLPLSVIAVGNALALGGFVVTRYRTRLLSGVSWRWQAVWHEEFPATRLRVLIAGSGEAGQTLAVRLKHHAEKKNYYVIGFVDGDVKKQGMIIEGCPILGSWGDIPQLASRHRVDLIITAVEQVTGSEFREILEYCEQTEARIKVAPDLFELVNTGASSTPLRDVQPEDLLGRSPITRHEAVDLTPVTHKVVLVTGAAGSIGSELSKQILTYSPTRLILVDNNESGLHDLSVDPTMQTPKTQIIPMLIDVTQHEMVAEIFATYKPEVVFHAAAYKHVPMLERYPTEALRVNVRGTLNVARLAQVHGAERFVLISTDKAVNPTNSMGASKRVCELIMHALSREPGNKTLFTSVRFGNVLGSRGSVVPTFTRQIDLGGPVTVTAAEMTRYFMTIPEAVNLVIHAACLTKGDDIFLLKMGETVRILELAERMIRLRGLRPNKDVYIEFIGARPGEKLHEELFEPWENPRDTVHPHIIELDRPVKAFDPAHFLVELYSLLSSRLDNAEAAAGLRQLIAPAVSTEERQKQAV